MTVPTLARQLLWHEARALEARLARVQPFALTMPMVPAAAIPVAAQVAIERHMLTIKRRLRELIHTFAQRVAMAGPHAFDPRRAQEQFTLLRMRFNALITQFDIFGDVLAQRSEHGTGVWVAGLDDVAADALQVPGIPLRRPPIICYLDRGHGAAIRRVRTRLPGGDPAPVAVINLPRERMIGSGVASSLVHEVGHQAASLLGLVEALRPRLQMAQRAAPEELRPAWMAWERWISEILADLWSVGKLGIGATVGLLAVVSLPRPFVFRLDLEDPHPFPWIRVRLSCALGQALYPDPQWHRLSQVWESLYPRDGLAPAMRQWLTRLEATLPQLVSRLLDFSLSNLGGRRVRDLFPIAERGPARLRGLFAERQPQLERLVHLPPTLAFAVLGQARADGKLHTAREGQLLTQLLTTWAWRSALGTAERCAVGTQPGQTSTTGFQRLPRSNALSGTN